MLGEMTAVLGVMAGEFMGLRGVKVGHDAP